MKIIVGVLAVAVVVLGVLLLKREKDVVKLQQSHEASIAVLSNDLSSTSAKLSEQEKVNVLLETNLVRKKIEIETKSSENAEFSNQLAALTRTLSQTKESLELTQNEVSRRNARIAELESQNTTLDKQAEQLKTAIGDLEGKIQETETKLAGAEGEKSFLLKELQRLRSEKSELERQFNDLAVLKEQVRKLKDELAIAQRLDWIRRGIYGTPMKGGERMASAFRKPASAATNTADLNVEIRSDGTAKIAAPQVGKPPTPLPAPGPDAPPKPQP